MIDSALMVPDILGLSDQIGQQLQVVVDALIRGLRLLNVLGRIFLDRNPVIFRYIIDYLQSDLKFLP